jgi:hypothetical protein
VAENRQLGRRPITTVTVMHTATFTIDPIDATTAGHLRANATIVRVADETPGFPCRRCLRDAEPGEEVVLVSYDPFVAFGDLAAESPYRCPSPIYLHRRDCTADTDRAPVPLQLARRQLSVRAFDASATMRDAQVVPGSDLERALADLFAIDGVVAVHVHNAGAGCFAARVTPG